MYLINIHHLILIRKRYILWVGELAKDIDLSTMGIIFPIFLCLCAEREGIWWPGIGMVIPKLIHIPNSYNEREGVKKTKIKWNSTLSATLVFRLLKAYFHWNWVEFSFLHLFPLKYWLEQTSFLSGPCKSGPSPSNPGLIKLTCTGSQMLTQQSIKAYFG